MAKKITRDFTPGGSRYIYDFKLTPAKGWAQIDTPEDASYKYL